MEIFSTNNLRGQPKGHQGIYVVSIAGMAKWAWSNHTCEQSLLQGHWDGDCPLDVSEVCIFKFYNTFFLGFSPQNAKILKN